MTGTVQHPAKFSEPVLRVMGAHLAVERPELSAHLNPGGRALRVLDPFAGTGRIHQLHMPGQIETTGVEIEPEWAALHPRTICADARALPLEADSVDALATSPCYGNRMADTYDGRGVCKRCEGSGWLVPPATFAMTSGRRECDRCGGAGRDRSRRHTYTIALGRTLTDGNAGAMQWGEAYRALHEECIAEWRRVVRPGGLVLVNMSNHIRKREEQPVVEWWVGALAAAGFGLVAVQPIETRRNRHGQNHAARVDGERLIVCRAPR